MWLTRTQQGGRDALAAYHENAMKKRNMGLGPNHDWSSHGADAFGLMALTMYRAEKSVLLRPNPPRAASAGSWMGMIKDDGESIVDEAREFFARARDADAKNRLEAIDDLKFVHGEQWPGSDQRERERDGRPTLTINKAASVLQTGH